MVVQPLFRKLNSENILHRAYYKNSNQLPIILEIGNRTRPYYQVSNESKKVLLSGTQNLNAGVVYELYSDHWVLSSNSGILTPIKRQRIEHWLDEVYTFREDHKVTEYISDPLSQETNNERDT